MSAAVDLVLLDINLPDLDGIEVCRRIKSGEDTRDIPVVMVTADSSENGLAAAFDAGAWDYVTKPLKKIELITRLGSVVKLKQEMDRRREREKELLELTKLLKDSNEKLQQANEMLRRLSTTDPLTGLFNRRYLEVTLEREWKRAVRESRSVSILMIDIDFFKAFNDRYGHQAGDECLIRIAAAFRGTLKRPYDILSRYGGEEFIAVLPDTDTAGAEDVAALMREEVSRLGIPHETSAAAPHITVSVGVATMTPTQDQEPAALIAQARHGLVSGQGDRPRPPGHFRPPGR